MKIIYITNSRIPTEKAHGLQIMKMCEVFAKQGIEVELIIPFRSNFIKTPPFDYYGVKENFKISYVSFFDFLHYFRYLNKFPFYLNSLLFLIILFFKKIDRYSVIYTRNPEIAWLFVLKGYKVYFSAHSWPKNKNKLFRKMLNRVNGIICNSRGTEIEYRKRNFKNTLVAHNAVDLDQFDIQISKIEARQKFNLPLNKKIVLYTGHLYDWKGVQVVADVSKFIGEDVIIVFVGGTEKDIEDFKIRNKEYKNILVLGQKPHREIPFYLKAADILLLPNISLNQESIKYTSPIKLFEYMASQRPIIASNLPSIREVLNGGNSVLVEPDNSEKLAQAINNLCDNQELMKKTANQAYQDVQDYTWKKRARKIINFIK